MVLNSWGGPIEARLNFKGDQSADKEDNELGSGKNQTESNCATGVRVNNILLQQSKNSPISYFDKTTLSALGNILCCSISSILQYITCFTFFCGDEFDHFLYESND